MLGMKEKLKRLCSLVGNFNFRSRAENSKLYDDEHDDPKFFLSILPLLNLGKKNRKE